MNLLDLLSDDVVKVVATGVAMGLVWGLRMLLKDKADLAERVLAVGIKVAFQVVNDRAKQTPGQIDDKVAEALKVLSEYLALRGLKLDEAAVARAKLEWSAMHGEGL